MNSLEYISIQGFKLVMRALLGGTFLPVQQTCKKKAKFSYRFSGRTGPLRALRCIAEIVSESILAVKEKFEHRTKQPMISDTVVTSI